MDTDNVTFRLYRKSNSLNNLSNSTMNDSTMLSLQNISLDDSKTNFEHNRHVERLNNDLIIANNEIDNLNSENRRLLNELEQLKRIVERYKTVGFMDSPLTKKRKRQRILDETCIEEQQAQQEQNETNMTFLNLNKLQDSHTSTCNLTKKNIDKNRDSISLENKTHTGTQKNDTNFQEINDHNTKDSENTQILQHAVISNNSSFQADVEIQKGKIDVVENRKNEDIIHAKNQLDKTSKKVSVKKILILADEQGQHVRSTLQNLLGQNYIVKSIWKPGARYNDIVDATATEVKDYTKDDSIIVIGVPIKKIPDDGQAGDDDETGSMSCMGHCGAVKWIRTNPRDALSLSGRALVAGYEGYDGSPLWIIRAYFQGELLPGKLAAQHYAAYVPWGGRENPVYDIEVCCANPDRVSWIECRDGNVPPNAVIGGYASSGEHLYIGRAKESGSLTPGKIQPSHRVMYMPYNGEEIKERVYDALYTVGYCTYL